MSRPPANIRAQTKDMYWFAHGGIETISDKCLNPKEGEEETNDSGTPTLRSLTDTRTHPHDSKSQLYGHTAVDSCNSSGPSSLELSSRYHEKQVAAEERRKQLWEAEQERNDAVLKKHSERDAALEARKNAQRSTMSFAFGSSIPRNVESLVGSDADRMNRNSNASGLVQRGEDIMSKSMTAAVPAPRGRRKNDLMPVVHYERIPTPKAASVSTRKRSVSMTRLDQLAQPRKHYVEATKAGSTSSSMHKDNVKSPTRPLSSASEKSGSSGRPGNAAIRRACPSPKKPRPVSIAGTIPDHKVEVKISPIRKTVNKKPQTEVKKATPTTARPSVKPTEKSKSVEKPKPAPRASATPKAAKMVTSTPRPAKQPVQPKTSSSPKVPSAKKTVTNKKKADIMVSSQTALEPLVSPPQESSSPPCSSPPPDGSEADRNNGKHIISEEEARAALAEKRRLAREQAEKEAELERQRQEELRKQEEERLRLEEEEQKRMEEEQLRLLEEHRQVEEEKLRKAIEENERKEEEERFKREEELRMKAEQEKKSQEEAEKQRIELEEKLRKEEEERAERKKRLEKIMSRTRGKTTGTSPSGSMSGSDQLDASDNPQENLSSGANSLDSNGPADVPSGPASLEDQEKSEPFSDGASMEAHPTYEVLSDNESLHEIVMPHSETASRDSSLVILPERDDFQAALIDSLVESSVDDDPPVSEDPQKDVSVGGSRVLEAENVGIQNESNVNIIANNVELISEEAKENITVNRDTENVTLEPQSTEVIQEVIQKSENVQLESKPVDHSEVVLSFEDADKAAADHSDCSNALLPDAPPSESGMPDLEMDPNAHFSTSSDIKLPDPIDGNTSDEGSMSSEKQLDTNNFGFQEDGNQQESQMIDEVFGEKIMHSEEDNFNFFEQKIRSTSNPMAAYESQFDIGGMQDSIFGYETNSESDLVQPTEFREESTNPPGPCASISPNEKLEANVDFLDFETKESVEHAINVQQQFNPFSSDSSNEADKLHSDLEQLADINPFADNTNIPEQTNIQNHSAVSEFSDGFEPSNVTVIKAEGSNECIGIISSVDHDHISNDLAMQQKIQCEQLKSNVAYSSVTDSEDSSLDSVLSQVMTGEVSDIKDSVSLINGSSKSPILNNEQIVNPFSVSALNGNSDSKSNGDHFYSETETLKNGHRLESSPMDPIGDFVQLVDGNHISSVDHTKNNIFDNVDAVNFGKISPDPFLAKGSSNQISGNPFLLQDDQKQVLMTPDFFN